MISHTSVFEEAKDKEEALEKAKSAIFYIDDVIDVEVIKTKFKSTQERTDYINNLFKFDVEELNK